MTERKLQTLPNNQSGYLARRGEILASLGPVDSEILTAIVYGRNAIRKKLETRRTELEHELMALDGLNHCGHFNE